MMRVRIIVFLLVFCLFPAKLFAEIIYTTVNLGSSLLPHGINDHGEVVGGMNRLGHMSSFLYTNGVLQDIGTSISYHNQAFAINNSGQVVGCVNGYPKLVAAFLYSNGVAIDIGNLGGTATSAYGINSFGQAVGSSNLPGSAVAQAFIYDNGTMLNLGTLGGLTSEAYGINDNGQVVGVSDISTTNGYAHAFLYNKGVMQDLGSLPTGNYSFAIAINNKGQIVGSANVDSDYNLQRAFLYENGAMKDLSTLGGRVSSYAVSINDLGQIVGGSLDTYAEDSNYCAFLYSNGKMYDLNTLVDIPGWKLIEATAINNLGQIVCMAEYLDGSDASFLLTPIPEPSMIALLISGAIFGVLFLRRKHSI